MSELRIAAEFGRHPLWRAEPDGSVADAAPADVVSPALAERLDAWAAAYDAIYDEDYPPDSAFASSDDEVGDRFDAVTRFDTDPGRWVPVRTAAT